MGVGIQIRKPDRGVDLQPGSEALEPNAQVNLPAFFYVLLVLTFIAAAIVFYFFFQTRSA